MSLPAEVQGFELMFEPAVGMAGVVAGGIQGMGVHKGMERGVGGIVGEKSAAIRAQQIIRAAGIGEREQKVVRVPGVEDGCDARRVGGAGRRGEREEERIGALAAGEQRAAQGGLLKEGKGIGRAGGDALMHI